MKVHRSRTQEKIKERSKPPTRGGKEGQWSARKSQLLTQEYEKRRRRLQGQSQINLERVDRGGVADERGRRPPGRRRDQALSAQGSLGDHERGGEGRDGAEETRRLQERRQYVSNTEGAKKARKNAKRVPIDGYDDLSVGEVEKKIEGLSKDASMK